MKAPGTQARRNRLANAPRRLVAQDDGGQHVLAAGACALRHGERGGDQRGAGMDDIPQVAVIGGRSVTHDRVDPCGLGNRQLGARVKPDEASGVPPCSLARSRMIAEDAIPEPQAALAIVLAISIAACSTVCGGGRRRRPA